MSEMRIADLKWFDRNPIDKSRSYGAVGVAPASETRWTYTVGIGKQAFIQFAYLFIHRATIAAPVGLAWASIAYTPFGAAEVVPLIVILRTNIIGDKDRAAMGPGPVMFEGDILKGVASDVSTGGTIDFNVSAKIVEFDAIGEIHQKAVIEATKPDIQEPIEKPWWQWW